MTPVESETQSHETDIEEIRQVIAEFQHAYEHHLVDEYMSLFKQDAIATMAGGKVLIGQDELAEHVRTAFARKAEGASTYELVHVLFIRPDVAAVKLRQVHTSYTDDQVRDEGTPLWIMTREDGRWWLATTQNTPVLKG
ncbi:SgcJ/EcaC family oxidoreductase [Amycolatopsis samaneae]|uniref:SgcJ/EcaC family oxidoreductase n=1 Tax=Amycolatopsis samaneae TaxID=664691 RepID=A0ABW5GFT7_9PSEU